MFTWEIAAAAGALAALQLGVIKYIVSASLNSLLEKLDQRYVRNDVFNEFRRACALRYDLHRHEEAPDGIED